MFDESNKLDECFKVVWKLLAFKGIKCCFLIKVGKPKPSSILGCRCNKSCTYSSFKNTQKIKQNLLQMQLYFLLQCKTRPRLQLSQAQGLDKEKEWTLKKIGFVESISLDFLSPDLDLVILQILELVFRLKCVLKNMCIDTYL